MYRVMCFKSPEWYTIQHIKSFTESQLYHSNLFSCKVQSNWFLLVFHLAFSPFLLSHFFLLLLLLCRRYCIFLFQFSFSLLFFLLLFFLTLFWHFSSIQFVALIYKFSFIFLFIRFIHFVRVLSTFISFFVFRYIYFISIFYCHYSFYKMLVNLVRWL